MQLGLRNRLRLMQSLTDSDTFLPLQVTDVFNAYVSYKGAGQLQVRA